MECSPKRRGVRRAAFTLLEAKPEAQEKQRAFIEIVRFIWDANPSYYVYREFSKRYLFHSGGNNAALPLALARHAPGRLLKRPGLFQ